MVLISISASIEAPVTTRRFPLLGDRLAGQRAPDCCLQCFVWRGFSPLAWCSLRQTAFCVCLLDGIVYRRRFGKTGLLVMLGQLVNIDDRLPWRLKIVWEYLSNLVGDLVYCSPAVHTR